MTSLDMHGFSVSVLPLDAELEAALLSEVAPRAWPAGRRSASVAPAAAARRAGGREARALGARGATRAWSRRVCDDARRAARPSSTRSTPRSATATRARRSRPRRARSSPISTAAVRRARRALRGARRAALDGDGRLERHPALDRRGGDGRPPSGADPPRLGRRRCAKACVASSSTAARAGRSHDARRAPPGARRARGGEISPRRPRRRGEGGAHGHDDARAPGDRATCPRTRCAASPDPGAVAIAAVFEAVAK